MSEHTPIPWEIVWEKDTDHEPPKRAESIGPVSADHDHWSGWTICDEADAEFVIRCVNSHDELLNALKNLRHEYIHMLVDYGSHVRGDPYIQSQADDAIKNAREK